VNHIIGASAPTPAPSVKTLTVDEDSAGQRLDNFLMRHLKGVPKTHVYRIIRSGEVRVNKGRASAEQRVEAGDLVRLPPVRVSAQVQAKADAPAPAREFPVLMEDEAMMAIDKPAGVAVHGGSGVSFGVIEQLRRARPASTNLELVHRLDRETSGVLLVAKKRSALKNLQDQFRDRETGKTYLALVLGLWPSNKKVIDSPLFKYTVENGVGEGERRVKVVGKDDPNGMRSITLVRVARTVGPYTLLEVTIRRAAPTKFVCIWPAKVTRLQVTTNTVISSKTKFCKRWASSACSCMRGSSSFSIHKAIVSSPCKRRCHRS
jgi:23S rRNA pseudouridine955/2504/2580 synthase